MCRTTVASNPKRYAYVGNGRDINCKQGPLDNETSDRGLMLLQA